jgi:DNA repair protein RadC
MSAAQKQAQANFKKAIAYRSKTGCSLKEAFAHVKGNKVTGVKKTATKKKAISKKKAVKKSSVKKTHKDTKSHNVNIKVVSGWKKGATYFREKDEGKVKGKKNYAVSRVPKGSLFGGGTFTNFKSISGYNTQPEIIVGRIGNIKKIENLIPAIKVRVTRGKSVDTESIQSSSTSVKVFKKYIGKNLIQTQEHFSIMFLNNANKCIGVYMMSSGGYTAVVADVRIILGAALRLASTGIILCHNHPSGNLQPSQADLTFTQKIKIAAQQMDIRVIDHIIVTDNGYYSFMENGDL